MSAIALAAVIRTREEQRRAAALPLWSHVVAVVTVVLKGAAK